MKEYDISDYGIFSDAISSTNSFNDKIGDARGICLECEDNLGDESVFMGLVAEDCLKKFSELNNSISVITDNFTNISQFLTKISSSYEAGDSQASENIVDLPLSALPNFKVSSNKAYVGPSVAKAYQIDFINSIKDGAIDAYNKYGVLPSLTLAQAALESGWGSSAIGNNLFGIKADNGWTGKTRNVLTSEQTPDGSSYQIAADFRDYDSINDSIVDHAQFLTKDRYKPVINSKSYKDACKAVKDCGYATDVEYTNKLINVIETFDLAQWDPKI